MIRDITYCSNDDCPFTDCMRHMDQLKDEKEDVIISIANFGGVCRQYINHLVGQCDIQYDPDAYVSLDSA